MAAWGFLLCVCVCVRQNRRLQEVKQQEEELLLREEESASRYLTYTVMPVLSRGLTELCRIRPNDAIDFLVGVLTLRWQVFVCSSKQYTAVCFFFFLCKSKNVFFRFRLYISSGTTQKRNKAHLSGGSLWYTMLSEISNFRVPAVPPPWVGPLHLTLPLIPFRPQHSPIVLSSHVRCRPRKPIVKVSHLAVRLSVHLKAS